MNAACNMMISVSEACNFIGVLYSYPYLDEKLCQRPYANCQSQTAHSNARLSLAQNPSELSSDDTLSRLRPIYQLQAIDSLHAEGDYLILSHV